MAIASFHREKHREEGGDVEGPCSSQKPSSVHKEEEVTFFGRTSEEYRRR